MKFNLKTFLPETPASAIHSRQSYCRFLLYYGLTKLIGFSASMFWAKLSSSRPQRRKEKPHATSVTALNETVPVNFRLPTLQTRTLTLALATILFASPLFAGIKGHECPKCKSWRTKVTSMILHKPKTESAGTSYKKELTCRCDFCSKTWTTNVLVCLPPAPKQPK